MSDIETIKERLNIVDLVGERMKLIKAGRRFKGLCPFHTEKTPSFIVSAERQSFHCFGCGKGGSIFDFVMEYEHIDFVEALEELAQRAGVTLKRRGAATQDGQIRERLYAINRMAFEFYQYLLTKHPLGDRARTYLTNRGISDKSIKTFGLGYSPNSWEGLYRFLRKKKYEDALIEQAGLAIKREASSRKDHYYDRFRGRLMFALKDHRGNIVGFSGRLLDASLKEAKYINTPETPVYVKSNLLYGLDVTKDAIQKTREAILMEGEFDVISSFQEGISNVVAIKGSALTEGHVHLLRRFSERLVFALDNDVAGDQASRRGIAIAEKAGLDMRVMVLPQGKDPDEAVHENVGLMKRAVKDAMPIYDYFFLSAQKRFSASDPFGKKRISEELLPVIAKIDNAIVKGHYVKKLASVLQVGESVIMEGLTRAERTVSLASTPPSSNPLKPLSRQEKLEVYTLALVLQGKTRDLFEELKEHVSFSSFRSIAVRQILTHLMKFLTDHTVFLIKDFADTLPSELTPTLDEAFLWDMDDIVDSEDGFLKEWNKIVKELQKSLIREEIQTLTHTIRSHDDIEEAQEALHEKIRSLTGKLAAIEKSE